MESKLRKEDVRLSDLVSQFLDQHFYNGTTGFERVTDRDRQVQGIDVIFDFNGKHYECDEKEAGSRINSNLKTFSLELSFINRGQKRQTGWFLNDNLRNDSYLFIWPDVADSEHPQTVEEIHEVEIALVDKAKLKHYLEENGLPIDTIKDITDDIVNNPYLVEDKRKKDRYGNIAPAYNGRTKYEINGFDFCHSEQLYEKPVNIILPREVYRKIADYNTVIKA